MLACISLRPLYYSRTFLRNCNQFRFHSSSSKTTKSAIPTRIHPSMLSVAILGPPNAGKSTLFNRFMDKASNRSYKLASDKRRRTMGRIGASTKKQGGQAIVSQVPGTTRDRRECVGRIGGTYFRMIDTAGVDGERIELTRKDVLLQHMMQQTREAAQQADLVLLMFDARVGVTSDLLETARWVRKASSTQDPDFRRRIVVLANKVDGTFWDLDDVVMDQMHEVTRLGFGTAIPISAQHGEGMAEIAALIEELTAKKKEALGMKDAEEEEQPSQEERSLQLAILGRQNVGKSTLVNALLKQERVLTGATPGLTRDAIAIEWTWNGRPVQIVDTAGIRKRTQRERENDIEDLAVQDALRAMKVADVAVLVLDSNARMLQRQELAIASAVIKEGRSLVIVANKMDLIVESDFRQKHLEKGVRDQLEDRFPMLRKTPIIAMSSLNGRGVDKLLPVCFQARDRWARKISTGQLNRWLKEVLDSRIPPMVAGKPVKIKYVTQTKGRPPTFLLFCSTDRLPDNYIRFLTRHFQDTFDMYGMEVRLAVKKSALTNPYDSKRKRSGSGPGGREVRKKRLFRSLTETGLPPAKGRRRKRKQEYR